MRYLYAVAVALAAALLLTPGAQARPTGTLTIDVRVEADQQAILDFNQNNRPDLGEVAAGNGTVLRTRTDRRIGRVFYTNTVTQVLDPGSATRPPDLRVLFNGLIRLRRGDILLNGVSTVDPARVERWAVIGGTGRYRGARGEARDRVIRSTDEFQVSRTTIRFTR